MIFDQTPCPADLWEQEFNFEKLNCVKDSKTKPNCSRLERATSFGRERGQGSRLHALWIRWSAVDIQFDFHSSTAPCWWFVVFSRKLCSLTLKKIQLHARFQNKHQVPLRSCHSGLADVVMSRITLLRSCASFRASTSPMNLSPGTEKNKECKFPQKGQETHFCLRASPRLQENYIVETHQFDCNLRPTRKALKMYKGPVYSAQAFTCVGTNHQPGSWVQTARWHGLMTRVVQQETLFTHTVKDSTPHSFSKQTSSSAPSRQQPVVCCKFVEKWQLWPISMQAARIHSCLTIPAVLLQHVQGGFTVVGAARARFPRRAAQQRAELFTGSCQTWSHMQNTRTTHNTGDKDSAEDPQQWSRRCDPKKNVLHAALPTAEWLKMFLAQVRTNRWRPTSVPGNTAENRLTISETNKRNKTMTMCASCTDLSVPQIWTPSRHKNFSQTKKNSFQWEAVHTPEQEQRETQRHHNDAWRHEATGQKMCPFPRIWDQAAATKLNERRKRRNDVSKTFWQRSTSFRDWNWTKFQKSLSSFYCDLCCPVVRIYTVWNTMMFPDKIYDWTTDGFTCWWRLLLDPEKEIAPQFCTTSSWNVWWQTRYWRAWSNCEPEILS